MRLPSKDETRRRKTNGEVLSYDVVALICFFSGWAPALLRVEQTSAPPKEDWHRISTFRTEKRDPIRLYPIRSGAMGCDEIGRGDTCGVMRYNATRYDHIRRDPMRADAMRFHAIHCILHAVYCDAMRSYKRCGAMRRDASRCNPMPCDAMRCYPAICRAMRCDTILYGTMTCDPMSCNAVRSYGTIGHSVRCDVIRCDGILCGAVRRDAM